MEEDGVWYIECVVVMVPTVPPPRKSVERLCEREGRDERPRRIWGEPISMDADAGVSKSASGPSSLGCSGESSSSGRTSCGGSSIEGEEGDVGCGTIV